MRTLVTVAAALAALMLTGCATTYTLGGEKAGNATEFLAKVDAQNDADVAQVAPLPRPVTGKRLMFAIPGRDALLALSHANFEKAQWRKPAGLAEEMLTTLSTGNYRLIRVYGHAISKRGIYKSVRMVDLENSATSTLAASAEEDVLYYYESGPGTANWYYVSQKGGKQVFAADRSAPNSTGKVNAFLEAVQLQAIKD